MLCTDSNLLSVGYGSYSGYEMRNFICRRKLQIVYTKIPCASCEKYYIGEIGRKYVTRLKKHKTEVESITSKPFTRNQRASHQVCLSRTNQHWLTMHLMTTTWSIGQPPLFWTENPTKVLDGSKRQYIFEKKDGSPWTGTRGATCWATRMTNFLPRRITVVARTGRRTEQTSSDEGLW